MPDTVAARIDKAVAALLRKKLLVGIPSDAKQVEGNGKEAPLWLIGYINEFGDDGMNIPPRPFLLPGVESVKDRIADQLAKGAAAAFRGDLSAPDRAMHSAGLIAQGAVKARLVEGPFTPLKPTTIYARQHRKSPPPNNRTSPLIDQRNLFNSINYVVKR